MEGICSFSGKVGISCRESRGVNKVKNLLQCIGDIKTHLETCHLSKTNLKEQKLILLRAGLFNLSTEQISSMTVCCKHRNVTHSESTRGL